jgi:dTDP-4-dehydrorhamnose 3,5-epimerase
MRFRETGVDGAFLVDLEPFADERGFLARAYCQREFAEHGLVTEVAQANLSHNVRAGTLRGLHYQVPPAAEAKFVRCLRGAVYDVLVDLRPDSPTRGQWFGAELSAANGTALYLPPQCAHGFQTLVDDTLLYYQSSAFYAPEHERGLRHDDPALGIAWPREVTALSDKDRSWPLLAAHDAGADRRSP